MKEYVVQYYIENTDEKRLRIVRAANRAIAFANAAYEEAKNGEVIIPIEIVPFDIFLKRTGIKRNFDQLKGELK